MAKRYLKDRVISVRVTEKQFGELSKMAKADDRTISNVVQIALEVFLTTSTDPTQEVRRLDHLRSRVRQT